MFSTICAFSQDILREFVVLEDDNPQVFFKGKGCTPDDGVIVFYTTIPDLKFSMPDTPSRLKTVSPYDNENNCYVLCVQPTDTKIGGIMRYSIAITANGYKPMPAFMVTGIMPGVAQYFMIKPKTNSAMPGMGYDGSEPTVAIQRFSNETAYARGIFYDRENDPIGQQAVTILSTQLAQTEKFILFERPDRGKSQEEWQISDYQRFGADYLIMGTITEFGRKNENVRGKKYQIAQASISIRLVDVSTGQIVFAKEAKGEAKTDGKATDYDSTLGDKAIASAISKLVDNINKLFQEQK